MDRPHPGAAPDPHILDPGIELMLNRNVVEYDRANLAVECTYTGRRTMVAHTMVVTVTSRLPNEELAPAFEFDLPDDRAPFRRELAGV